jgi:hypothetical protein
MGSAGRIYLDEARIALFNSKKIKYFLLPSLSKMLQTDDLNLKFRDSLSALKIISVPRLSCIIWLRQATAMAESEWISLG